MKPFFYAILLFATTASFAQQPGTLDPSFGNKGTLVDPLVADVIGGVMKVSKDGRILIGTAGPYKGFDFTFKIDAYLPDGSPDLSFGENGSAYVLFPDMKKPEDNAAISSLALLPDGRILACGNRYSFIVDGYVAFALFKPDGTADSTFGNNGTVVDDAFADYSEYESHGATSIVLQPDGKIVTAGGVTIGTGQSMNRISTARYLPDGRIDKSYGENGITVSTAKGAAFAVALQKDGKIVSAGYSGYGNINSSDAHFHLERYNADGSYDKSFGINGMVDTKIGSGSIINDVALQDDGKIVVAGNSNNLTNRTFTVARYNTDGSLDNSFGTAGIVPTIFNDQGICDKVFITGEKKDKIVATGKSYNEFTGIGDFAIAGYNSDGSPDPEFGNGGIQITNIDAKDRTYSADLQPDGKIVQFGYTSSNEVFRLHRAFARYYGYPQRVPLALRIKRFLLNHGISWKGLPADDKIAYYSVEQSNSASKGFMPVAKVSGAANQKNYSITNSHLLEGINFYRIKAVSTDGTIRYSETVSADNTANTASVFPNPAKNYVTVQGLKTSETANISISDGSGNVKAKGVSTGSTQYRSSLNNLQPGTYYVNITTKEKTETLKFVKE